MLSDDSNYILSEADKAELEKLVSILELSSGTTIIFAIAPESSPQHLVVKRLKEDLKNTEENFKFHNFFYSENSFHNFLYSLDENVQTERRLIMAFGLDQLPTPRLVKEMQRLNLGREELFDRNLILIFWLNQINFLDEFRHRAPDFWDWREKVVQFETRNPLLYPYLEWLIAENSYLKMSGVMQVNRQVDIFLDQIYVSLQAQRRQEVTETSDSREIEAVTVLKSPSNFTRVKGGGIDLDDDDRDEAYYYEPIREKITSISSTKTITEKVELSQAVRENAYSVILGTPGAGKTTLLRYLALHFATAKRDDLETVIGGEAQEDLGKTLLPIFFRIADYAEKLKLQPNLTLTEYLRQFYRQWEAHFQTQGEMGTEVAAFLLDAMRQGKCLMLLDGLDEVFDQESRREIVESINQFVDEFPHNKYIITSRIAGYRDVQLSSRFAEYIIEDMSSEKVEQFLYRWCRTVEKAQQPDASEEQIERKGNEQAANILNAIQENEGVKRLTANPLLLTILALIHRNGERLPNRRVKLYELAVQTLIEDWQLSKKLPDAPKVVLRETEVVEILAPLAYWMHEEKPSGLVTETEVQEQLATKMAELNDAEPESDLVRQAVGEFLRKVRETTGLFVERAPGVYGFMHLTFEEYFAARYIADNDQSKIQKLIQQHLHEPRWNEPILLALGYYGIHFPGQAKKLIDKLFSNIQSYQPALQHGEIKIKTSADNTIIIYLKAENNSAERLKNIEFNLQDLFFAGQVIAEVEVSNIFRKNVIKKLIITYISIDDDFENNLIKQLLRTLRKIELFYQKGEVIAKLTEVANDVSLSQEMRIKAKTAIFYITCGQSAELVNYATELVNQLEPSLFGSIRDLVQELGEEMTPTLEISHQYYNHESCQKSLIFLTAMSYVRKEKYDKAIEVFELLTEDADSIFGPYIAWSLANCYQEKGEFDKAIDYYQKCFEKLARYIEPSAFILFWNNRGVCHRLNEKYEKALDCFMQMLTISKETQKPQSESLTLYHIGRTYQDWGKYEQAIRYYEQSRELYQQLGKEKDVANQWFNLADCYREWGKYQQAVDCQNEKLAKYQQLDDKVNITLVYCQLGRIYQSWGKYEQAISYYEQSRELYQQLGKEKDVANQWSLVTACYREWGKYEQAVDGEYKNLAILQQLDDQVNIASAYQGLGYTYQDWGKYEKAISYYEQSRELYQQLGKEKNVANQLYNLANCYREWGKYQQAVDCQNKKLAKYQQLDDQVNIALAYWQLGKIYQDWGKYEQAISYYAQSRELYQQLAKEKSIANQWYWMANCYREWGKYQQAVDCENQDLYIRQQLDDQDKIALAYWQLGRIYEDWGKYEKALSYYEQSRELYQQLGKEKDVANLWYRLADCYREWGKYQQAVDCENQDLAIRQQLEDQDRIALAYFQLARIYEDWGKYEQAISYYEQSRELYQQLGKEKDVANQWFWTAVCYREWRKYQQAIDCENQDLAIRQQLDDQDRIALAYAMLGTIYQGWGKYKQGISYYEQSRELYQQLGKDKDVANRWSNLAGCYREWGKYQQAVDCENQDLAIRQQFDDQVNVASAYWQLGRIYQGWGKYEQAISYYEQSRELYQQLGKEKDVADSLYNLASCYREWGKYQQAVDCENKNLAIRQQLDDKDGIASAYWQLGWIYQDWGKYEQAISYHEQSRELYQQLDKEKNAANQWYWIADCYKELGKYQQAVDCQNQKLAKYQHLDDQVNIALGYYQLGRIYQGWGKYEQAISYYEQSREFYQLLGKEKDVADLWYWLANCYREWGQYQQAVDCENQDLEIRQQLDDQDNIADAYKQLGRIYQGWGKYEQAISYYEQSRELYQQLGKEKDVAIDFRRLAYCQILLAKNTANTTEVTELLKQAETNIHQAIDINTLEQYQENLAYDYTKLSLLYSAHLHLLPVDNSSIQEKIALFEEYYHKGFTYFDELGQIVNKAEEALDIARIYLEVEILENLTRSEEMAQECLQIFRDYNRPKLTASAYKLLGEIYLKRTQKNQSDNQVIANQFLTESLQIYQDLDLQEQAGEITIKLREG